MEKSEQVFLIGQRVIVGDEIGTVQRGASENVPYVGLRDRGPRDGSVWVHLPSRGYASCYANHNVKPLPNGQL